MNILDLVVGKPIRTSDERAEQIGPIQGIPIFGLDALSSAAYGPEAALSLLIPLGLLGVRYIVPISAAIITLLVIVFFSYRQTIAAYPSGGGSYTVARFNLGAPASLLAAAALLADYILTAAVGISAGVGALVSAVPSLLSHTVSLCVGILVVITILNLRGVREAGSAFAVPTYLFVGTLLITIVAGVLRVLLSGGHPTPAVPLPPPPLMTEAVSFWLLLKVFASGCTALTGVEAVSNGVKAFREPTVKNAQRTLTVIIFLLAVLLAGISYLVKAYGIAATDPGQPGYQSVLSMLIAAVFGKGFFYYLTIGSILVVLSLSANTAFADFPRLCRAIAQNNYLPHVFGYRGRRLVYTYGIVVLAILCGSVLILFGGITDRLIPLYAVGAFLAFTLSQAGMVMHWRKNRGPNWLKSALVNGSVLDAAKAMRLFFEHPDLDFDDLALPFLDARKRVANYPQRRTPSGSSRSPPRRARDRRSRRPPSSRSGTARPRSSTTRWCPTPRSWIRCSPSACRRPSPPIPASTRSPTHSRPRCRSSPRRIRRPSPPRRRRSSSRRCRGPTTTAATSKPGP